jgi:hypothetical protein
MARPMLVPIIDGQRRRSWPKHDDAKPCLYRPLSYALTHRFSYDAHVAAYSAPEWPRRLCQDAVTEKGRDRLPSGVPMRLAVFDIDAPGHTATDAWRAHERDKIQALLAVHPGLFIYMTRGGYRFLGQLPDPDWIVDRECAGAWSERYLAWCAYLTRRFQIAVDPVCQDWTRLYRLPHATRTPGGMPEHLDTCGDPTHVGLWDPVLAAEDLAVPAGRRRPSGVRRWYAGDTSATDDPYGALGRAFRSRGWLGEAIDSTKWRVRCPWEAEHTIAEAFDGSVLFAPSPGATLGWFHCAHTHCLGRSVYDVLAMFTAEELGRNHSSKAYPRGFRTVQATGTYRPPTVLAGELPSWRR